MGCGASKSVSVVKAEPIKPQNDQAKVANVGSQPLQQQQQASVGTPKKLPPIKAGSSPKAETASSQAAALTVEDEKAGKGGVAFSITVDGGTSGGGGSLSIQPNSDIDKILRKPLPPRLRHLEPLESVPVMTPEQLAEKLRKAEEKRERMLEKRRHSKVTKKSKARREQVKALDSTGGAAAGAAGTGPGVDLNASSGAGGNLESLQQKQASAEQKRLAKLAAVQEKQRLREERARAARERAKLMKQEMLESELQIEKDEAGDESDTDSWLGDNAENNEGRGRKRRQQPNAATSAPPLGHQQSQRDSSSSGYSSRDASSATDRLSGGDSSAAGSRVQTGKTVSTVLEGELDNDFYD